MGLLPTIHRRPFVAVLIAACVAPGWGQTVSVPERHRASCQEVSEARRHVPTLGSPIFFPHLRLAVLEDIKELERRPEDTPGEWSAPLRRWYEIRGDCPQPAAAPQTPERMSEEERALRSSGLERRLIELAITGRITKTEFDGLVRRLQGE